MAKTIVRNFRKNSEIKTYQLSEKDRQAIIASNPWPSVWEVIKTQRAAFKKRYGDNFFQEKTYKLSEKDRQAIFAANPYQSVWKMVKTQRAAFKAMHGDYFGQPVEMAGVQS